MSKRVRMLSTHVGTSDGFTIETHTTGFEYNLSDSLAYVYIGQGWAEEVTAAPAVGPSEAQAVEPDTNKEETQPAKPKRGRPRLKR